MSSMNKPSGGQKEGAPLNVQRSPWWESVLLSGGAPYVVWGRGSFGGRVLCAISHSLEEALSFAHGKPGRYVRRVGRAA
jgi:hypothetical protein